MTRVHTVKWMAEKHIRPEEAEGLAAFARNLGTELHALPDDVRNWCEVVRQRGAGLLHGVPIPFVLPATPVEAWRPVPEPLADNIVVALGGMFGQVAVVADRVRKSLVFDIYPISSDDGSEFGSSGGPLAWHTEDAFHSTPPDWVVLLCLRASNEARTRLAHVDDLEVNRDELRTGRFEFRVDEAYQSSGRTTVWPILSDDESGGMPRLRFDPMYMNPMAGADDSVCRLGSEADRVAEDVVLQAGDLLVFDNRRIMHARTGYAPTYLGHDRWLKRVVVYSSSICLVGGEVPAADCVGAFSPGTQ
jgi:L-asparagine oxygenase